MPERLPQGDALRVEESKIVDYLLNHEHPDGASKAKFFSAFGFNASDWRIFADAMRRHGRERDVVKKIATEFGTKYEVECSLAAPDGRSPCIRSVWIVEAEQSPRLVTAHPVVR